MNFLKKYPILASLIAIFLLGVGGGIGVLYWLDSYTHHGQALLVPNLYEMQVPDAERLLEQEQLRCLVVDSLYKKGVLPGAIVDQVPSIGAKVKQGRIVFLTINATHEKQVMLPNVNDLSERQAKALIAGVGLEVANVKRVESPYKGLVVGVTLQGRTLDVGEKIAIGTAVTLLVGKGSDVEEDEEVSTDSETNQEEIIRYE